MKDAPTPQAKVQPPTPEGLRVWFQTTWNEIGEALLSRDLERLAAIEGKLPVLDSGDLNGSQLQKCCRVATTFRWFRQSPPETTPEPTDTAQMLQWLNAMQATLDAASELDDPVPIMGTLGDQLKLKVVEAVQRRDEQSVLEVYYRLFDLSAWRDAVTFSDWSDELKEYKWMKTFEDQILEARRDEQWDESMLSAVGEAIRLRLVAAVRARDSEVVLALCWRIVDESDNTSWLDGAGADPGYDAWCKANFEPA